MSDLQEIIPRIDLPQLHQVNAVNVERCRTFASRALPLMMQPGIGFFHVCDTDSELSKITDELLEEIIELTGTFDGPIYADTTGYNFDSGSHGAGNCNDFHSDGCNEVAIVSTSGVGFLHLAWLPRYDSDGKRMVTDHSTVDSSKIVMVKGNEHVGYIKPIDVITCVPGTLVRINQPNNLVMDSDGTEWELEHGLYNAHGKRISLLFRSFGPEGYDDGTSLRRPIS